MSNTKLTLDKSEWTLVGHFGVDAGLVWIGDPCYVLHTEDGLPTTLGKDWGDFCEKIYPTENQSGPTMKSFSYELGHEGLGVCCSTGYGDGTYPVYVRIVDEGDWGKRIAQILIDFLGAFDDPDEDDEDEEIETCSDCGMVNGLGTSITGVSTFDTLLWLLDDEEPEDPA